MEVTISLSTLSQPSLKKLVQTSARHLEEVAPLVSDILKISKEQVLGVGEFKFVEKSLIIELAPEVDLASLKIEPRPLVRFLPLAEGKELIRQTAFSPDMTIITQMQPDASSSGKLRTNSRVFCIDMEDPVVSHPSSSQVHRLMIETGSAHAFLTGYHLLTPASERLPAHVTDGCEVKDVALDARQLSERGGKLYCELKEGGMVDISGTASDWGTGTLTSW